MAMYDSAALDSVTVDYHHNWTTGISQSLHTVRQQEQTHT